eukprot:CAMPEP_0178423022 /NCGR_PEP_ID=MMETSP0689_2-20121128/27477_1 /TAXON_ID=160604 /ORGANISM="Amphidinium massartii, Strain CS-259" /LENGTH=112 /DNA_ID=CAMNT_0020044609 /DNA_START=100 /DNA_END=438 /DNA_ORIENTATION=-
MESGDVNDKIEISNEEMDEKVEESNSTCGNKSRINGSDGVPIQIFHDVRRRRSAGNISSAEEDGRHRRRRTDDHYRDKGTGGRRFYDGSTGRHYWSPGTSSADASGSQPKTS